MSFRNSVCLRCKDTLEKITIIGLDEKVAFPEDEFFYHKIKQRAWANNQSTMASFGKWISPLIKRLAPFTSFRRKFRQMRKKRGSLKVIQQFFSEKKLESNF